MNAINFIEHNTGLYIFLIAMTLLLSTVSNTTNYLHVVGDEILDDNVIYEVKEYNHEDMIIESKDIIAMLTKELDYDIKINTLVISKDTFNYRSFDFTIIKDTYSKSYELDENGVIKYIVFN